MANEVRINVTSKDRSKAGFDSARRSSDQLGDSTKRVGEIASGILASQVFERFALAAKQAFTTTVAAASNLNESVNAVQVTFGNAGDSILRIGETADTSMGLSQRAFNEAAVRFSAFAQTIAGDGGNVSQVVQDVTARSSDFASVMNIEVAQAMELFQSGLAGESEPLRRYGIDISAAATKTEAYASGIAEAGAELSEAEKVQARYNLIMKQTADTSGDFANTSDDMANAQRIFNAELENFQAEAGEKLLPLMGSLIGLGSDVLAGFEALPGPLQAVVGVLAAGAALTPGIWALRAAMVALGLSLGPIGIALAVGGAIVGGLAALGSSSRAAEEQVRTLKDQLREVADAGTGAERSTAALAIQNDEIMGTARDLNVELAEMVDVMTGVDGASESLRERIEAVAAEEEELRLASDRTLGKYSERHEQALEMLDWLDSNQTATAELAEEEKELKAATEGATEAVVDHEAAIADAEEAYSDAKTALDDYVSSVENALDPFAKYRAAQDEVNEAQEAINTLVAEGKRGTPEYEQAILDLAAANSGLEGAGVTLAGSINGVIAELDRQLEAGEINQEMYDDLRGAAEDYAGDYTGNVHIEGAREAKKELDDVRRAAEATEGNYYANVFRTTYYNEVGRSPGGSFAHGGIVGAGKAQTGGMRGRDVLINEARPEVVSLPDGSRVIPSLDQAFDRNQMGAGGAGGRVVLELRSSGSRIDDLLLDILRDSIRVQGGDVQVVLGSS